MRNGGKNLSSLTRKINNSRRLSVRTKTQKKTNDKNDLSDEWIREN